MENLVNPAFWRKKKVFVTGHTGFKGGWLSLWLREMGACVRGYALPPSTMPSFFEVARLERVVDSRFGDLRDAQLLADVLHESKPEIVFHLAAQALVPESYSSPVDTFSTNVMGTALVLDVCRQLDSVKSVVVVSSDKCYENREWVWPYRESDPMGGYDPYSASKGCTELVVASYRRSFYQSRGIQLASARAGNVIGGGDWSPGRLVPDILHALDTGQKIELRNPDAIRPWQHVLEPLSGYLGLAQQLYMHPGAYDEGWNFGPSDGDAHSVEKIVRMFFGAWGDERDWFREGKASPHEAQILRLDSSKARSRLGWKPRWTTAEAVHRTTDWFRAWRSGSDMHSYSLEEIRAYGIES